MKHQTAHTTHSLRNLDIVMLLLIVCIFFAGGFAQTPPPQKMGICLKSRIDQTMTNDFAALGTILEVNTPKTIRLFLHKRIDEPEINIRFHKIFKGFKISISLPSSLSLSLPLSLHISLISALGRLIDILHMLCSSSL